LIAIWFGGRSNFIAHRKGYVMISRSMGSGGSKLYRDDNPKLYWRNVWGNFAVVAVGIADVVMMAAQLSSLQSI
jgi:hypothetical protein